MKVKFPVMKVMPSSSNLASGKYYSCGVDVCEEGIQFCNVYDRRCEYCTDHHQDCFTNVQQQNCTSYCHDQWTKNLKIDCPEHEHTNYEDMFKILFIVTLVLLVAAILIIILQVRLPGKVRKWIVSVFDRKNDPTQPNVLKDVNRTIEDENAVRNNGIEVTKEEIKNDEKVQKHRLSNKSSCNDSEKAKSLPDIIIETPPLTPQHAATFVHGYVNNHAPDKFRTSTITHTQVIDDETELLKKRTPDEITEMVYLPAEHLPDRNIPHGELSTMSSRGDYQAFVLANTHNNSTDKGYVTAILKSQD